MNSRHDRDSRFPWIVSKSFLSEVCQYHKRFTMTLKCRSYNYLRFYGSLMDLSIREDQIFIYYGSMSNNLIYMDNKYTISISEWFTVQEVEIISTENNVLWIPCYKLEHMYEYNIFMFFVGLRWFRFPKRRSVTLFTLNYFLNNVSEQERKEKRGSKSKLLFTELDLYVTVNTNTSPYPFRLTRSGPDPF